MVQRGIQCKKWVKIVCKYARNVDRFDLIKSKAREYGIIEGVHLSWGYDPVYFDEYFGEVDASKKPHTNYGVKFYADGSVYVGAFDHGQRHTESKGTWIRGPDGAQYEGQWLNDVKHGRGTQLYPDGARYTGEFAKGYEHGNGTKIYPDGSRFDGRFRFGKRDGLGVFTDTDGREVKKSFKDGSAYYEPALIDVSETDEVDGKIFFEPETLQNLAIDALSKAMQSSRHLVPATLMSRRLPEHLKPILGRTFLETMHPRGSDELVAALYPSAFSSEMTELSLSSVRVTYSDAEALIYLSSANMGLKKLQLTANRLDAPSLDMISKLMLLQKWPILESINISCNKIDITGMQNLIAGITSMKLIKELDLSICKVTTDATEIIAR